MISTHEEWKPINGFDGYEVSSFGQVKSLTRFVQTVKGKAIFNGTILKTYNKNGYLRVRLQIGQKRHYKFVHRLVAEAFLTKEDSSFQVNHLNFIKSDNSAKNLEWCSASKNQNYNYDNLKVKDAIIVLNTQNGIFYPSLRQAAKAHCIPVTTLRKRIVDSRKSTNLLVV